MKILSALYALFLWAGVAHGAEAAALNYRNLAGRRLVVLGDSITQDGRYVAFLEYYLLKLLPEADFDVLDLGLSSETVSGLSEVGHAGGAFPRPCLHTRLERALEKTRPAIVMACYGMNDGIYQGPDPQRLAAFQNGLTKLVERARAAGARVVLVTPPVFDHAMARFGHDPAYDDVLTSFAQWVMAAPALAGTLRIDLHTAMRQALADRQQKNPRFHFAADGVHPSDLGHLLMAQTILRGLGAPVSADLLEVELKRVKADPLWPLVSQRQAQRGRAWMKTIGYTRERVVSPGGDVQAAERQAAERQRAIDALRRMVSSPGQ